MTQTFRVVAVCTGNVCRSPMFERLLQVRLAGFADAFDISSAGTRALEGAPMDAAAAAELRRLGGDPAGFVARQLQENHLDRADLVLTATLSHRSKVLRIAPQLLHKTFTVPELASLLPDAQGESLQALVKDAARRRGTSDLETSEDFSIRDPYQGPAELHAEVADEIALAVDRILEAFAPVIDAQR